MPVSFNGLGNHFCVLDFMFPDGTLQERMKVCDQHNVKLFCKDYVEKAEFMFIIASVACVLVILSLVSRHFYFTLFPYYHFDTNISYFYLSEVTGVH